jgi:hypothetical protein
VLADLHAQAPAINRFVAQLGPFATAGLPAVRSLGKASVPGRQALVKAKPIAQDLRSFASTARPLSNNLASLTTSLKRSGGVERLMDYLFFQTTAINGYDSVSHYLRAGLILNQCSSYAITFSSSCSSKFGSTDASEASARAASTRNYVDDPRRSDSLRALDAYFHGETLDLGAASSSTAASGSAGASGSAPAASPAPAAKQPQAAPAPPADDDTQTALLDYLLGGGG